jgi:transcription initiation factor TFIIE subunit beta
MQAPSPAAFKRKRDFSQQSTVELGQLLHSINVAIGYLKDKRRAHNPQSILGYLSLHHSDKESKNRLLFELRKRPDVIYNSDSNTYKYKPKINVTNADELRAYLSSRPTSVGVRFDELKDGWPDCQPTLNELEKEGHVLMIRDRKDAIKLLWNDEASLRDKPSDELQHMWAQVKLPLNSDDLRARLEKAGLKPTSAPKITNKVATEKKKRTMKRASKKQTNAHIEHLLKDYSNKKK